MDYSKVGEICNVKVSANPGIEGLDDESLHGIFCGIAMSEQANKTRWITNGTPRIVYYRFDLNKKDQIRFRHNLDNNLVQVSQTGKFDKWFKTNKALSEWTRL